jgi:hypothetical protein
MISNYQTKVEEDVASEYKIQFLTCEDLMFCEEKNKLSTGSHGIDDVLK